MININTLNEAITEFHLPNYKPDRLMRNVRTGEVATFEKLFYQARSKAIKEVMQDVMWGEAAESLRVITKACLRDSLKLLEPI